MYLVTTTKIQRLSWKLETRQSFHCSLVVHCLQVRLIVNTGVAVLESVTSLNNLFYHTLPGRGEYANLMLKEDNVDFHLLIDQVASAKLVTGKSSRGDIPTYMVRFVDNNESVAVSLLVMWKPGTDGEYDNGQVDAFQQLLDKFGPEVTFSPNESTSSTESWESLVDCGAWSWSHHWETQLGGICLQHLKMILEVAIYCLVYIKYWSKGNNSFLVMTAKLLNFLNKLSHCRRQYYGLPIQAICSSHIRGFLYHALKFQAAWSKSISFSLSA